MKAQQSSANSPHSLPKVSELVAIGRILRPHGVRGEMRTLIMTDFPERFMNTEEVFFLSPNRKNVERHTIEGARFHANCILLKFPGIDTPEKVAEYRDWLITVPQDDLVELEEGEYWHFQLEGLSVVDDEGKRLGTLKEVVETPGHDLYAVQPDKGKEMLIPAVKEYILKVDLDKGIMVVKLPEMYQSRGR